MDVSFDASASTDSDGSITGYLWDFDDGNTGTGQTIDHTFSTPGEYEVTLTVTDNEEVTDTTTQTINAFLQIIVVLPQSLTIQPVPAEGKDSTIIRAVYL